VTDLNFAEVKYAGQVFVKNYYAEFRENPVNRLVVDAKKEREGDRQTDGHMARRVHVRIICYFVNFPHLPSTWKRTLDNVGEQTATIIHLQYDRQVYV
jgi:hypothetical protein